MPEEIEDTKAAPDTSKDPNEGMSMLDFVKQETGIKTTEDVEAKGDAQKLGKTEDEKKEIKSAIEDGEPKTKEIDPNETEEQKKAREEKEATDKEVGEKEDEEVKEEKVEEKGPVPYERFEEVNNKYKVTVEEYERVKPLAEAHHQIQDFCSQYNITQDQFSKVLQIQALLNTDPAKALEQILPIVEAVQGFTGDKLPPDLQSKVDTGKIELADAREIAKLRAQSQFGASRFQQFQKIQQERTQTAFQEAQVNAINAWTQNKVKLNPEFKPRANKEAPKGMYEFVYDAVQGMINERDTQGKPVVVINTPTDITKLLEQAYQDVDKAFKPMTRKPATKRALTHNGSGQRNTEVKIENAKTMGEAIRIAAAEHGL